MPPTLPSGPDPSLTAAIVSLSSHHLFTLSSSELAPVPTNDVPKYPEGWSSLIGIITAIVGNILISFALNTQRYAHIRLAQEAAEEDALARRRKREPNSNDESRNGGGANKSGKRKAGHSALDGHDSGREEEEQDEASETDVLLPLSASQSSLKRREHDAAQRKSYLHSPYWWIGIVLMTVGEAGNFLAYGFAPASIVSPLGVVALISNCMIAPFMLKESFRARDLLGVLISVGGAVTVVLSAKSDNPKLGPDQIWYLITRWEFETYLGISVGCIIALMWASRKYGQNSIFIDLGLVGLFGGYTVLSTKGVASLLSYKLWRVLTFPVTYLLVFILVFTAIMQIKYVNRALQRFDSTQVIPTQFVMFTLSVILGSAILYRDFEKTPGDEAGKFVGGCALTFLGVYLITSARGHDDEESEDGEEESVEVTEAAPLGIHRAGSSSHRNSGISFGAQIASENSHRNSVRRDSLRRNSTRRGSSVSRPQTPSLFPSDLPSTPQPSHLYNDVFPPTPSPAFTGTTNPFDNASPLTENPWKSSRDNLLTQPPPLITTASAPLLPSEVQTTTTPRPSAPQTAQSHLAATMRTPSHLTLPQTPSTPDRRFSVSGLLTGPLMSPFSASLSAAAADTLRKASLRSQRGNPRQAALTANSYSSATRQRGVSDADILQGAAWGDGEGTSERQEGVDGGEGGEQSPRGRARSFSEGVRSIFGFFTPSKRKDANERDGRGGGNV